MAKLTKVWKNGRGCIMGSEKEAKNGNGLEEPLHSIYTSWGAQREEVHFTTENGLKLEVSEYEKVEEVMHLAFQRQPSSSVWENYGHNPISANQPFALPIYEHMIYP